MEYKEIDLELSEEIKEKLREWHDSGTVVGLCCAASNEGLWCCIDFLTGDANWRKEYLNE